LIRDGWDSAWVCLRVERLESTFLAPDFFLH